MTEKNSITVIYHSKCKASTDFLIHISTLENYDKEYINLFEHAVESEIELDVVPLIILNNNENNVYKGKQAFEMIDKLKNEKPVKKNNNTMKYNTTVSFIEPPEGNKKEKITLDKK